MIGTNELTLPSISFYEHIIFVNTRTGFLSYSVWYKWFINFPIQLLYKILQYVLIFKIDGVNWVLTHGSLF